MSDAACDSHTPQKLFRQEAEPEPEGAGEDVCHLSDSRARCLLTKQNLCILPKNSIESVTFLDQLEDRDLSSQQHVLASIMSQS